MFVDCSQPRRMHFSCYGLGDMKDNQTSEEIVVVGSYRQTAQLQLGRII